MADEVMIGDRPLAWKVAETTPNRAGRKCSKDDLPTYAGRYYFEHQAAARRYLDRYRHCLAWAAAGPRSRDRSGGPAGRRTIAAV